MSVVCHCGVVLFFVCLFVCLCCVELKWLVRIHIPCLGLRLSSCCYVWGSWRRKVCVCVELTIEARLVRIHIPSFLGLMLHSSSFVLGEVGVGGWPFNR